jgi:hypothetical protein
MGGHPLPERIRERPNARDAPPVAQGRGTRPCARCGLLGKGCSSLGRLRYAVLLRVKGAGDSSGMCLIDIKEAVHAAAPRAPDPTGLMPADSAERVVMGARALAPALGTA